MSQLYSRVFLQILESSIAEDFTLRHVFEDFLKLCDHKTGVVDMTRQALSRRINLPLEILNDAITKLESPDKNSRDSEFEGRRIERLDSHRDWGWRIVNWGKYELMKNRADVSLRVARHRAKDVTEQPNGELFAGSLDQSVVKTQSLDPIQLRLNAIFKRRKNTRWSPAEIKSYKLIAPIDEQDLKEIERYYSLQLPSGKPDYRRREMITLLNNFNGEVDKARKFKAPKPF